MRDTFDVVFFRYHLLEKNTLIFQGYYPFDNPKEYDLLLEINGKKYPMEISENEGNEVRRRYIAAHKNVSREYVGKIALPENIDSVKKLRLYCTLPESADTKGVKIEVYRASASDCVS